MKCRIALALVVVTVGFFAACSNDEELHSGSPCLEGQHQECKGDEASIRCNCVENDGGTGAGGSDAVDGDLADSNAGGD